MEKTAKEKYWSRFPDTYDENQDYVVAARDQFVHPC